MRNRGYKKILDDITCDSCGNSYCILKELLLRVQHPSPRTTIQIKCMDKFKFEQSVIDGKDIGWPEAIERWIKDGYATAYSKVWSDDKKFLTIYKETLEIVRGKK